MEGRTRVEVVELSDNVELHAWFAREREGRCMIIGMECHRGRGGFSRITVELPDREHELAPAMNTATEGER